MSKEFKRYLPIWAIIFVIANIVLWIIDLDRTNGFWTSYIIVTIALLAQLGISYYALSKKRVLSASIIMKSIAALIVLILLNIYILYSAYIDPVLGVLFPDLPLLGFVLKKTDIPKVIIVIDCIILAVNYITVILLGQHGERIEQRDQHVKEKTDVMRKLTAKAKTLAETRNNPQLKRIYEELRYSKNISTEEGLICAERINDILNYIENNNDNIIIVNECEEIIYLIKKLNSI